jgi:hypothetical protein
MLPAHVIAPGTQLSAADPGAEGALAAAPATTETLPGLSFVDVLASEERLHLPVQPSDQRSAQAGATSPAGRGAEQHRPVPPAQGDDVLPAAQHTGSPPPAQDDDSPPPAQGATTATVAQQDAAYEPYAARHDGAAAHDLEARDVREHAGDDEADAHDARSHDRLHSDAEAASSTPALPLIALHVVQPAPVTAAPPRQAPAESDTASAARHDDGAARVHAEPVTFTAFGPAVAAASAAYNSTPADRVPGGIPGRPSDGDATPIQATPAGGSNPDNEQTRTRAAAAPAQPAPTTRDGALVDQRNQGTPAIGMDSGDPVAQAHNAVATPAQTWQQAQPAPFDAMLGPRAATMTASRPAPNATTGAGSTRPPQATIPADRATANVDQPARLSSFAGAATMSNPRAGIASLSQPMVPLPSQPMMPLPSQTVASLSGQGAPEAPQDAAQRRSPASPNRGDATPSASQAAGHLVLDSAAQYATADGATARTAGGSATAVPVPTPRVDRPAGGTPWLQAPTIQGLQATQPPANSAVEADRAPLRVPGHPVTQPAPTARQAPVAATVGMDQPVPTPSSQAHTNVQPVVGAALPGDHDRPLPDAASNVAQSDAPAHPASTAERPTQPAQPNAPRTNQMRRPDVEVAATTAQPPRSGHDVAESAPRTASDVATVTAPAAAHAAAGAPQPVVSSSWSMRQFSQATTRAAHLAESATNPVAPASVQAAGHAVPAASLHGDLTPPPRTNVPLARALNLSAAAVSGDVTLPADTAPLPSDLSQLSGSAARAEDVATTHTTPLDALSGAAAGWSQIRAQTTQVPAQGGQPAGRSGATPADHAAAPVAQPRVPGASITTPVPQPGDPVRSAAGVSRWTAAQPVTGPFTQAASRQSPPIANLGATTGAPAPRTASALDTLPYPRTESGRAQPPESGRAQPPINVTAQAAPPDRLATPRAASQAVAPAAPAHDLDVATVDPAAAAAPIARGGDALAQASASTRPVTVEQSSTRPGATPNRPSWTATSRIAPPAVADPRSADPARPASTTPRMSFARVATPARPATQPLPRPGASSPAVATAPSHAAHAAPVTRRDMPAGDAAPRGQDSADSSSARGSAPAIAGPTPATQSRPADVAPASQTTAPRETPPVAAQVQQATVAGATRPEDRAARATAQILDAPLKEARLAPLSTTPTVALHNPAALDGRAPAPEPQTQTSPDQSQAPYAPATREGRNAPRSRGDALAAAPSTGHAGTSSAATTRIDDASQNPSRSGDAGMVTPPPIASAPPTPDTRAAAGNRHGLTGEARALTPIVDAVLVRQASFRSDHASSSFRVVLQPATLGTVVVDVQKGQSGLHVTLTPEHAQTQTLLSQHMPDLESALRAGNLGAVQASVLPASSAHHHAAGSSQAPAAQPNGAPAYGGSGGAGAGQSSGSGQQPGSWAPPEAQDAAEWQAPQRASYQTTQTTRGAAPRPPMQTRIDVQA